MSLVETAEDGFVRLASSALGALIEWVTGVAGLVHDQQHHAEHERDCYGSNIV
jgi:hypothetical protein